MSEPRRSTRARAREDAAPAPETPKETPVKGGKSTLKRKRGNTIAAPATPTADAARQAPKHTLPLRVAEGQPLPTLPEPQPLELAASEWQDIQQSGVLSASLQQSRAVWVSGVNFRTFHEFFTQPKKVPERTEEDKAKQQRQKELQKNFPQVGAEAQLVIEPHTFPIKLYGPREMPRTVPKKTASYGAWPTHSQPTPYPPPYSQPYPKPPPPPAPRPPPPKPVAVQQTPTPATSTPAPDPVIHMLAARAGTDPELKAVMKIVAAGQATKEQLEFFQIHIQELTDIVAGQKEAAAKASPPKPAAPPLLKANTAPSQPTAAANPPQPKATTAPPPASPRPPTTAAPPLPRPVQSVQPQHPPQLPPQHPPQHPPPHPPQNLAKTYTPTLPQPPHQHAPPVQPHAPSHTTAYSNTSYNHPPQYHPPHQVSSYSTPPPLRTTYRPLVFSFVEGNQDMFYFPSYSFMEWLPNGSGAKLSFLITRPKPKPKSSTSKPESTPAPKPFMPTATPTPLPATTTTTTTTTTPIPFTPIPTVTPLQPTPFIPTPRIEDFDEKHEIDNIDFYQPVTVLLLTDSYDIKNALARAIRPPDVVERYMEDVFDRCRRAEDTYLAFRLPRDSDGKTDGEERRASGGDLTSAGVGGPVVATPGVDSSLMGGWGETAMTADKKRAGRPRKSIA